MGDVGVELVLVNEVVFEAMSGTVLMGTQGAAVIVGLLAERDVELKVVAI